MKKILILSMLIFILFSCNNNKNWQISQIKQELLNSTWSVWDVDLKEENIFDSWVTQEENFIENNEDKDLDQSNTWIINNQESLLDNKQKENQVTNSNSVTNQNSLKEVINPQVPEFKISKNQNFWEFSCETLQDFLKSKSSWYYWNTCKKINDNIFTLNFLDFKNWNYNYYKLYIDTNKNILWEVFLESWTWSTWDDMIEKNSLLREKSYLITNTTDNLFINYENKNEIE